jgi:hypothetical protein
LRSDCLEHPLFLKVSQAKTLRHAKQFSYSAKFFSNTGGFHPTGFHSGFFVMLNGLRQPLSSLSPSPTRRPRPILKTPRVPARQCSTVIPRDTRSMTCFVDTMKSIQRRFHRRAPGGHRRCLIPAMRSEWLALRIWAEVYLRWTAAWLGKLARPGNHPRRSRENETSL